MPSTQTISPTGIAPARAFGTPQLNLNIAATGIDDGEALGTPTVVLGAVISPSGFVEEALGTPVVSLRTLVPAGFFEEALGTPTLVNLNAQFVKVAGWNDTEAYGSPTVTLSGPSMIYPVGVPPS